MMHLLVFGHFTLAGSREQATYSGPSRFDPFDGGTYNRPDGNCMTLKSNTPKEIQPGSNLFKFEIGNGDALPGLCMAYLKDANKKTTKLNKQQDCVSEDQAMSVDIPNVDCVGCVLQIRVQAGNQYFDSCVDITIQKPSTPQKDNLSSSLPSIVSSSSPTTFDQIIIPQTTPNPLPNPTPTEVANDGQVDDGTRVCLPDGISYLVGGSRVVLPEGKTCVPKKGASQSQ